jgi:catechol 2,3-dioxygenase-like lactoylglutathione lyase family enzyme
MMTKCHANRHCERSEAIQGPDHNTGLLCFARNDGKKPEHSMIDHVSVGVAELERSARFYEPTLAALGLTLLVTRPTTIGFGKTYPEFWINLRAGMAKVTAESGVHICLRAKTTDEVDAFHAAALGAGGVSDGAPGIRPHDRVRYYAAFVIDPDGNRIEAVTFPRE